MKMTTTQLRRLIAEEVRRLVEGDFVDDPGRREPLDSSLRRMPFEVEEGPPGTGGSIRLKLGKQLSFSVVMSPEDAGDLGAAIVGEAAAPSVIYDTLSGQKYVIGVVRHPDGGVTLSFTDSFAASKNRDAAPVFNMTLSADDAAVLADLLQAEGMNA